eukprot:4777386-Alexandrium_andersonii.AAC.1
MFFPQAIKAGVPREAVAVWVAQCVGSMMAHVRGLARDDTLLHRVCLKLSDRDSITLNNLVRSVVVQPDEDTQDSMANPPPPAPPQPRIRRASSAASSSVAVAPRPEDVFAIAAQDAR